MTMPSDVQLFDFETSQLADWDDERAQEALRDHPDVYRSHLLIARWAEGWADRLVESPDDEDYGDYVAALMEVAAHLRQADFVPGGALFDEATSE